MREKSLLIALLVLLHMLPAVAQVPTDSLPVMPRKHTSLVDLKPLRAGLGVALPMVVYDLMYLKQDYSVARMRQHFAPHHQVGWDDVTQLVPLATAWAMKIGGIQGRSNTHWEMLSAQATSYALAMGTVYATKHIAKRVRPDNRDLLSMPSGHTAFAFASAAMLDAEYGSKYPWVSALGYGLATATGVGRVLNNRHWSTDVVTGAGVGLISTYLGYLLNDLMWGRGIQRFDLTTERENYESWAYVVLRKGRTDLLSKLEGYEGTLGSDVSLAARYPIYRQVGARVQGSLWESYNPETEAGTQSYALMVGGDFMQGFWSGRLWVDAAVLAGGHAPIKLTQGAWSTPRSEALSLVRGGIVLQGSVGLSYILTDHMALNIKADYTILSMHKIQGFGGGVGLAYWF